MNSSVILILGKAKDWVSNSTVNIKRQKSQSHRVLCRGNAKGSSSSFKLQRGSGREAEVLSGLRLYLCPASRMRQATAVIRAAPFPLPSSDSRKDTSHLGARSFTVSCMTLAKLEREREGV